MPSRYVPQVAAIFIFAFLLAGCGDSGGSSDNGAPVATIAGPLTAVPELTGVILSAADSSDPDGDALEFLWEQTSGPSVSYVEAGAELRFVAPKVTNNATLEFRLTVIDPEGGSASDTFPVTVHESVNAIFIAIWDDAPGMQVYRNNAGAIAKLHTDLDPLSEEAPVAISGYDIETFNLSVSPDRRFVAYLSDRDGDFRMELYVAALDGGGEHKIAADDEHDGGVSLFEWSPDSRAIAFRADLEQEYQNRLYVAPLDGHGSLVSEPVDVSGGALSDDSDVFNFAWHPAGDRLFFLGDLETPERQDLFMSGVATINGNVVVEPRVKLSADPAEAVAPFTPGVSGFQVAVDGTYVVYRAEQELRFVSELYAVALEPVGSARKVSGTITGVTTDPDIPADTRTGEVMDYSLSPDGRFVAFRGNIETWSRVELFVTAVAPDGTPGNRNKVSGSELAGGLVNGEYRWAPSGSRLAYVADTAEASSISIFDLFVASIEEDGSISARANATSAGNPAGRVNHHFEWSPQGDRLAIWGDLETMNVLELFVATTGANALPDGNLHKVSATIETVGDDGAISGDVWGFDWSPDGEWLAYNGDLRHKGVNELRVVNVSDPAVPAHRIDISGISSVNDGDDSNGAIDGELRGNHFPFGANPLYQWSPRSNEIFFRGDLDHDEVIELYRVAVSTQITTGERSLVSPPSPGADGEPNDESDMEDGVSDFVITGPAF